MKKQYIILSLLFTLIIIIPILKHEDLSSQNIIKTNSTKYFNTTIISDGEEGIFWNNGNSETPAIVIDNSNNIHVVWVDTTEGIWGNDTEIMYSSYTEGVGWSNATVISDDITHWNDGDSLNPAIVVDNSNVIHVVWDDNSEGIWTHLTDDKEILYTNYTNGLGWSNASVISDGLNGIYWNTKSSNFPGITIDSLENLHLVWQDYTEGDWGTDLEIMYSNYTYGLGWSNATVISDGYNGIYWNDGDSFFPSIAVNSSGGIHVVWMETTNGFWGSYPDTEIMYVSSTNGLSWSNVTIISDGHDGDPNWYYGNPEIIPGIPVEGPFWIREVRPPSASWTWDDIALWYQGHGQFIFGDPEVEIINNATTFGYHAMNENYSIHEKWDKSTGLLSYYHYNGTVNSRHTLDFEIILKDYWFKRDDNAPSILGYHPVILIGCIGFSIIIFIFLREKKKRTMNLIITFINII